MSSDEFDMKDLSQDIQDADGLTARQKEAFSTMRQAKNICLMRGQFRGEPVGIISAVFHDEADEDNVVLLPLYVEATQAILDELEDSYGNLPVPQGTDTPAEQLEERFTPLTDEGPMPKEPKKRQKLDS